MADLTVPRHDDSPQETIKYQRPELGEWCEFDAKAMKTRRWPDTTWTRWPWIRPKPQRGMYIGWRTVHDGRSKSVYYGDEPEGWEHKATRYHEVWLFIVSERENPVHVFPADVRHIQAASDDDAGGAE